MTEYSNEQDFLTAFFSDETERFRSPTEPDPGQTVNVRIRAPKVRGDISVMLIAETIRKKNGEEVLDRVTPMKRIFYDPQFDMYEASFVCPDLRSGEMVTYYYRIEYNEKIYIYQKNGLKDLSKDTSDTDPMFSFRFMPGFHTPDWSKGAVQYQIFPERFCNGDETNDVQDGEYSYNHRHVRRIAEWDALPSEDDYRCYYGGDIAGILNKLDYLQELGIEVIYLNPVFLSPSSHKYDTQDYEHIDPHLGVIRDDVEYSLKEWEFHNGYARRYIKRVTSEENLELSDALFAKLCEELHSRNMKIILDGVFNHCGSFHWWMDREGIYREKEGFYEPGAYQDKNSPYREFFRFTEEKPGYEAWWDVETLPKLDYENSRKLWDTILDVAEKWLSPPYCIDGWRLDVAADLGHSPDLNHSFWKEFRGRVKSVNPDAIIIAEHYGDPSDWLKGDEWDTVMNYSAFMEPVTYFLTGMEKHSDGISDDLYQDGKWFFESMRKSMAVFQNNSLHSAMNELSNHDHSRFLTRTNRTVGRTQTLGAEAASKGIDKAVFREAVLIQMTWPGAPTIYYGDEAGLAGWTDPDNRRCYPWGNEDEELIDLHRQLIAVRRHNPVLKDGSIIPLGAGSGWIAYARFDKENRIIVVCNNNDEPINITLDVRQAEACDGQRFDRIFECGKDGHSSEISEGGTVTNGQLRIELSAKSAVILK